MKAITKKIKKAKKWAATKCRFITDTIFCTSVFDDIPRNISDGWNGLIPSFEYLNGSDRPEAEKVRKITDDMWKRYPLWHRMALRERLRSRDNTLHLSTFFELFLHELLLESGCRILKVEPRIKGSTKRPDFLVKAPDGTKFYLEAKMTTAQSQADSGAQRRVEEALHAIDTVPSSDFFLSLSTSGAPTASITRRQLKHQLREWLETLDYGQITTIWSTGQGALPTFHYQEHGWRVAINPVPRNSTRGTSRPSRAIASRLLNPLTIQPQEPLKVAIQEKATRYGDVDRPFIIAVNTLDTYAEEGDIIDALFGTSGIIDIPTSSGWEARPSRSPDGVWRNGSGPINTRVSAVLSTERLTPWDLGQRRVRVVLNPWARKPISSPFPDIDIHYVEGDLLLFQQGRSLQEIFGLSVGWPEY